MKQFTKLCLFFFLLNSSIGLAELKDHFKKAEEKSDINRMRNIDFIYMINLDQRPEKYERCMVKFAPYGIYPYRFSAVNGWELSLEDINDVGVVFSKEMRTGVMGTCYLPEGDFTPHHEWIAEEGRTYFCHCMSRGAIGIVLSHLSILQDAYNSGYETIWVMEDDIEIVQDPNVLSEYVEKMDQLLGKEGWDVLFTDQDTRNIAGQYVSCTGYALRPNFSPQNPRRFAQRVDLSKDFRRLGARYGAYSMIVRRSGMKKILDFFREYKIFLPYDMDFVMPEGIRCFNIREDIVRHVIGEEVISDNGGPNYLNKKD